MKTFEQLKDLLASYSPYNQAGELINQPFSLIGLGQFYYGDDEDFIEASKELKGRVLTMGNIVIQPSQTTDDNSILSFSLRVMAPVDVKDTQEKRTEDSETLRLLRAILAQLKVLQKTGELKQANSGLQIEPIATTYGTSYIGWEVNLSFEINFLTCIDPLEWN